MRAYLFRFRFSNSCTIGILYAKGEVFYTLELPWLDNKRNKSCIPVGEYKCEFMPRSSSGKYKSVYHVKEVDGRGGILIHNGNTSDHTRGCILLGNSCGKLLGRSAVLASRSAMKRFVRLMNKESFTLRVVEWNG